MSVSVLRKEEGCRKILAAFLPSFLASPSLLFCFPQKIEAITGKRREGAMDSGQDAELPSRPKPRKGSR